MHRFVCAPTMTVAYIARKKTDEARLYKSAGLERARERRCASNSRGASRIKRTRKAEFGGRTVNSIRSEGTLQRALALLVRPNGVSRNVAYWEVM